MRLNENIRPDPRLVDDPNRLPELERRTYIAQIFFKRHPEVLPETENFATVLKYLGNRPWSNENMDAALAEAQQKEKILPPFEYLDLDNKPPEATLAAAKKYGVRKVDQRGREYYDFPEAWKNQPFIKRQPTKGDWEGGFGTPAQIDKLPPGAVTRKEFAMMGPNQIKQLIEDNDGQLPAHLR